ncbi:MAG: hypothetical protein Fur0010_24410 [Bdellovibrio sp.]
MNVLRTMIIFAFLLSSVSIWASDYPELNVAPRASERLKIEAERENNNKLSFQWPFSVSALLTLTAGIMQDVDTVSDPNERSPMVGIVVGGSWLALNAYLAYGHRGYRSAYEAIKDLPAKTEREQLTKERLAEEEINRMGLMAKRLKYISFATNGAASIYLLSNVKKDTKSQVVNGLALAGSFLPLLFTSPWENIATEQQLYKRKIFAPVASTGLLQVPGFDKTVPGLIVSATF